MVKRLIKHRIKYIFFKNWTSFFIYLFISKFIKLKIKKIILRSGVFTIPLDGTYLISLRNFSLKIIIHSYLFLIPNHLKPEIISVPIIPPPKTHINPVRPLPPDPMRKRIQHFHKAPIIKFPKRCWTECTECSRIYFKRIQECGLVAKKKVDLPSLGALLGPQVQI